jgi:hypothetical protein
MPFTVSHAVAVLPLATGRPARLLNPTALVIGTAIPDLAIYLPQLGSYAWSHSLLGPVSYDLVVGMAMFALWTYVLRRPLTDLAPKALAARLPAPRAVRGWDWLWVAVSVVIGAATHALWDSFTHAGRWGTTQFPVLNAMLDGQPIFRWLQLWCSLLGMAVLVWWFARWWARTSPRPLVGEVATTRIRWLSLLGVVVAGLLTATIIAVIEFSPAGPVPTSWRPVGVGTVNALMAAVLACCLCWWLAYRHTVGGEQADGGADPGAAAQ